MRLVGPDLHLNTSEEYFNTVQSLHTGNVCHISHHMKAHGVADDGDQWDRMISSLERLRGVKSHTALRGATNLTPHRARPPSHWWREAFLTPRHCQSRAVIGGLEESSHLDTIIILLVCSCFIRSLGGTTSTDFIIMFSFNSLQVT